MPDSPDNIETIIDPRDAAESAGLRYVSDARPGICRKKAGTGFTYTPVAMALNELESFDSAAQAKRNVRAAIEKVASKLGNTPTICRKCYVHPEVPNSYMDGNLVLELKSKVESELRSDVQSLKPEEAAVLALLRGRLAKYRPASKKQRANAA